MNIRLEFQPISELVCESCIQRKHVRASHPPRVISRYDNPFTLVYSDVWGPYPVKSITAFRYFVTFKDEFSHATWIFIIKSKQEIFSKFSTFCSLV